MTLLTPEDAGEKWCPLARVATPVTAYPTGHVITAIAANRASKTAKDAKLEATVSPESARCIGSQCMAWRWHGRVKRGEVYVPAGYCGAFGVVES